jgi:ribose 5-phosphate isomerase B
MDETSQRDLVVYVGADHRGFALKNQLVNWLILEKINVEDVGAHQFDPDDDYPDIAQKLAQRVVSDSNSVGVVLCGSGVGVTVAANKVDGVRAGLALSQSEVAHARSADDINVLAISAEAVTLEEAKRLVQTFLVTPFNSQKRYVRRLQKIAKMEENN